MTNSVTLIVSCPDRKGIVASIAEFIFRHNGNILFADEHGDEASNLFLTRVEFDPADFDLSLFPERFAPIARDFQMDWRLARSTDRPRVAIFVSKYDHCLQDLLYRHWSGELRCEIPLIISNHPDNQRIADFYHIPYFVVPVAKENKREAEQKQIALVREHKCSVVVLARYMQVLSNEVISSVGSENLINIHHSFLPAFVGSKPYHQAFERGVKLIGATAHYVTQVLDDGPIIEQDVVRIHHRDTVDDLIQKGRDLEKLVLSRAIRWHVENRILLYGNKTVVFQ
ncbi:MAG TPA: formyltetrahydrofolate deformylase [Terriglobales bacterium]|jgi:formyltetrahydrofolate deformylase|nr:formyltetrahydrofolate deformylase [Terriglobales bacterium]